MKIREAELRDVNDIFKIKQAGWLETYPNEALGITAEAIQARQADDGSRKEKWESALESGEINAWIADVAGEVVGFCTVKRADEYNHITQLYVDQANQKQGIGSQLISTAMDFLGTEKPIQIEVAAYNVKALEFYKKHGFQCKETIPDSESVTINGVTLPEVRLSNKK